MPPWAALSKELSAHHRLTIKRDPRIAPFLPHVDKMRLHLPAEMESASFLDICSPYPLVPPTCQTPLCPLPRSPSSLCEHLVLPNKINAVPLTGSQSLRWPFIASFYLPTIPSSLQDMPLSFSKSHPVLSLFLKRQRSEAEEPPGENVCWLGIPG